MRRPAILLALTAIGLLWVGGLVAAPAAASPRWSAALYAAGSVVCHQRPERSFHLDGAQLPVCARCLGLYGGAVAGVLLWGGLAGVVRPRSERVAWLLDQSRVRGALAVVAAPTLITVGTAWIGAWDPANVTRALLAMPLGAMGAALATAVAAGDLR